MLQGFKSMGLRDVYASLLIAHVVITLPYIVRTVVGALGLFDFSLIDAARTLGLPVKLHAEQLSDLKGAVLAARFAALSADHIEYMAADGVAALRLADAGLAIDAAAIGLGRATVPLLLAEADLASGKIRAVDNAKESEEAYWLVAPLPQWRQKKVKALVEALTG